MLLQNRAKVPTILEVSFILPHRITINYLHIICKKCLEYPYGVSNQKTSHKTIENQSWSHSIKHLHYYDIKDKGQMISFS